MLRKGSAEMLAACSRPVSLAVNGPNSIQAPDPLLCCLPGLRWEGQLARGLCRVLGDRGLWPEWGRAEEAGRAGFGYSESAGLGATRRQWAGLKGGATWELRAQRCGTAAGARACAQGETPERHKPGASQTLAGLRNQTRFRRLDPCPGEEQ